MSDIQRGFIACYEDNGIDARPLRDGVLFDENGSLTRAESFALAGKCEQQLVEQGVIPEPDLSEEGLRVRYEQLTRVRSCLIDMGYAVPDLPSTSVFLASPDAGSHPYDYVAETAPEDLPLVFSECPDNVVDN